MEVVCVCGGPVLLNTYLAIEDGQCVVVDPGAKASDIIGEIQKRQVSVRAVLLTHCHFDHILCAGALRQKYGEIPFFIHRLDAAGLGDEHLNLSAGMLGFPYRFDVQPEIVEDGQTIAADKEKLHFCVLHTPGHTPGSVCYFSQDAVFTGDTLFCGSVGRTDLLGGDAVALAQSIQRLVRIEQDYKLYPGHGSVTSLFVEKRNNPYLQQGFLDPSGLSR